MTLGGVCKVLQEPWRELYTTQITLKKNDLVDEVWNCSTSNTKKYKAEARKNRGDEDERQTRWQ